MSQWKTTEVALLKEKFPQIGVAGCAALITTHSVSAIQTKARDLRLKTQKRRANDLLVAVLNRFIEAAEGNGDINAVVTDARSVLREVRRAA